MPATLAILLGVGLGLSAGGSFRNLKSLSVRHEWAILVGFLVQGVARGRLPGAHATSLGLVVWVLSTLFLIVALALQFKLPGVFAVCTGLALNLVIVLANGGMPVAVPANIAQSKAPALLSQSMGFYHATGAGTVLAGLGDVLPVTIGGSHWVLSAGDVLLAVGVAAFVAWGTLRLAATEDFEQLAWHS